MANVNRYVEGEKSIVLETVKGGVTVELGDLMFHNVTDGLRNNGGSTADYSAYPFEYLRVSGASLELNKEAAQSRFLGVAMNDKDGITGSADMRIAIATAGRFNFDLKPGSTVYAGNMFGASGTTSASNLYNQKVMKTEDTSKALGRFAEHKIHALNADVWIMTKYSTGVIS